MSRVGDHARELHADALTWAPSIDHTELEAKARAFRAGEQVTWQRALADAELNAFAARALDPGWEGAIEKTDRWYLMVASKTAAGEVTRTAIPLKGSEGARTLKEETR